MKNFFIAALALILAGAVICLISVIGFEGLGALCLLFVLGFIESAVKLVKGIFSFLFGTQRKN